MKARWAAGDSGACHSDSTRSNWPSLALRARWAVAGQPRKQAATESDIECGVRELSLSSFFYLLFIKTNQLIIKSENMALFLCY
jgi:hypothetical protein